MAYALTKPSYPSTAVSDEPEDVASSLPTPLNPALDTLEAGKRGEIAYCSPLNKEKRAARRAFLAKRKPPTQELRAQLAARRNAGRATNEI